MIDTTGASPVVIAAVAVGNGPYGLAVGADGTRVYAASTDDGTVSVIDTSGPKPKVIATLPGSAPYGVAVSPGGQHVYVANYGGGTVSVIQTET